MRIDVWLYDRTPREQRHLAALGRAPDDRAELESYADDLEELEEPEPAARARALRVALALAQAPPEREEALRGELRRALTEVAPEWIALAFPLEIRNCGVPGRRAPRTVQFDFECPRRWPTLRPTASPEVRECDACARTVYRCDTFEEAELRAQRGDCIAVPPALVDRGEAGDEPEGIIMGMPRLQDPRRPTEWSRRLFGEPTG